MSDQKLNRQGSGASPTGTVRPETDAWLTSAVLARLELDSLMRVRRSVTRGQVLFRVGEPLADLCVVRSGLIKTRVALDDGRIQVTGFHVAGDVLGLDAIGDEVHRSDAVALGDSQVDLVNFAALASLACQSPQVQRWLCRVLGSQVARLQSMSVMLRSSRAEERVAAFLMDLSRRGDPPRAVATLLTLGMSRADLGNYLGLTHETVSRCLSSLQRQGVLEVDLRTIRIRDIDGLSRISSGHQKCESLQQGAGSRASARGSSAVSGVKPRPEPKRPGTAVRASRQ